MPENQKTFLSKIKRFSYLISIVVAFLLPILGLTPALWKKIPKKPFFISAVTISIIGWIWSWVVSSNNWWTFGPEFLTGIQIIPHLPLEELMFYPLGGILSIFIYLRIISIPRFSNCKNPKLYVSYLAIGTIVFLSLIAFTWKEKPVYLVSQVIVFNFLCSIFLSPFTSKEINLWGVVFPIAILGIVGFAWNYIGFGYGWWAYHATTEIKISIVPIDDFNFFFYAPTAAISIYLSFCRLLNKSPLIP